MLKYSVTIQAQIAKTYEVYGVNLEHAKEQAHYLFNSEPDTSGTYGNEVIDYRLIEPEPVLTAVGAYERLRAYIQDITENQEPLDLLERLKP